MEKNYLNYNEYKLYRALHEDTSSDEMDSICESFSNDDINEGVGGVIKGTGKVVGYILKKIKDIKNKLAKDIKVANRLFKKQLDSEKRAGRMEEVKKLRAAHAEKLIKKKEAAKIAIEAEKEALGKAAALAKKKGMDNAKGIGKTDFIANKVTKKPEMVGGKKIHIPGTGIEIKKKAHKKMPSIFGKW